MKKLDLSDFRKSYQKEELLENHLPADAMEAFLLWFQQAKKEMPKSEINAFTLTTIGLDGFPRGRIVLLKQLLPTGFLFFTNYDSYKGQSIEKKPNVGLSFFWPDLERQIIVSGKAKKATQELSDIYFAKRPRGSQIGAWASPQSKPIERDTLKQYEREIQEKYFEKQIPRPAFWGGYIVDPQSIEFWQGRPNRLHDRILYTKKDKSWVKTRLAP